MEGELLFPCTTRINCFINTMQPGDKPGKNAVKLGSSELSFLAFQRFSQLLKLLPEGEKQSLTANLQR